MKWLETSSLRDVCLTSCETPAAEQQDEVCEPVRSLRYGPCYACGRKGHRSGDKRCPAKEKQCYKCHEIGYFSRCCRTKRNDTDAKDRQVGAVQVLTVQKGMSSHCHTHTKFIVLYMLDCHLGIVERQAQKLKA